jgi:hypothetical protein
MVAHPYTLKWSRQKVIHAEMVALLELSTLKWSRLVR